MAANTEALVDAPEMRAAEGVRAQLGHIATIEGLRGVAVLWVMVFHYCVVRATGPKDPWIALIDASRPLAVIFRNGYLGVDLFFLVTGFLLTLPWFRNALEARAAPSMHAFYLRRVRRIVPAYYVQLALLFFFFVPVLRGIGYWRQDFHFLAFNLAAHFSFLHYTTPITSASLSINGPLWTLALEAQYYLLLPLIAPCFVRWPLRSAAAMLAIAGAWRWLSAHDLEPLLRVEMAIGSRWNLSEDIIRRFIGSQLPGYLGHFGLGILAGRAWLHWHGQSMGAARSVLAWIVAAAAMVTLFWLYSGGGAVLGESSWLVSVGCMAVAMTALVSTPTRASQVLLANPALSFAGKVSYSAYLYHLPMLLVANRWWPEATHWAFFPAFVTAVLAAAWISYRYVEWPFMQAGANASRPRAR